MSAENQWHLAEFNLGILKYDWDDPRIADFANGIDRVNGIAIRSPGFVWMLDEEVMDAAQRDSEGVLGGNPRTASTLSVWEDVESLEHFVWNTVHKAFYRRRANWFDVLDRMHFAMWWVAPGTEPSPEDAMARLAHLDAHGNTDEAFGWDHLAEAHLWRAERCAPQAAE